MPETWTRLVCASHCSWTRSLPSKTKSAIKKLIVVKMEQEVGHTLRFFDSACLNRRTDRFRMYNLSWVRWLVLSFDKKLFRLYVHSKWTVGWQSELTTWVNFIYQSILYTCRYSKQVWTLSEVFYQWYNLDNITASRYARPCQQAIIKSSKSYRSPS